MSEPAKVIDIDRDPEPAMVGIVGWVSDGRGGWRPANWKPKDDPARAQARERLSDATAGVVTHLREYREWL